MEENAIIFFMDHVSGKSYDLNVRLDITAIELFAGLNEYCGWGEDTADAQNCYLAAENPIVLLRGNKTLYELGIRNGSRIHYVRDKG